ncbi:hypothetical protein C3F00_020975 [Pseudomonas sp. MWU13-2860]|nr:hypothetical protein C3F00_020975 [Pseudomonas sp. MWU13-2860]
MEIRHYEKSHEPPLAIMACLNISWPAIRFARKTALRMSLVKKEPGIYPPRFSAEINNRHDGLQAGFFSLTRACQNV